MPIIRRRPFSARPVYRRRRRVYKPKVPRVRPTGMRLGKRHIQKGLNGSVILTPNATSYHTFEITNITLGDKLDQRASDKILSRGLWFRGIALNDSTTIPRYIRVLLLTLRGSESPADTSTWTDLFIDNTYTKTGITGGSFDAVYAVNQDEYKVFFDRVYKIGAAANDTVMNGTTEFTFFAPTRKIVKYAYNSTDIRRNPLVCVILACESKGQPPSANAVDLTYAWSHYFTDVDKIYGHPYRQTRFRPLSMHGVQRN